VLCLPVVAFEIDLSINSPWTGCNTATFAASNAGETLTCSATNGSGFSQTKTVSFKIDKDAPTLTLPPSIAVDATSAEGCVVSYLSLVSASDNFTANPVISCTPAEGMFSIGSTTVTCSASDAASNSATGGFRILVRDAISQTANTSAYLASLNLGPKGNGLSTKLNNVQKALSDGNTNNACGQLGAFINQVRAKSGKDLTQEQAAMLIMNASRIQSVIGCR
jgi:hypothetical protein